MKWLRQLHFQIVLRTFEVKHQFCEGFGQAGFEEDGRKMFGMYCPVHGEGLAAIGKKTDAS